jgi:16S rRNA (guanine527-N7)-methyltransferase
MDLGTGGGFPGIPLAILFPETKFLLVDSIGKKLKVVEAVSEAIKLSNVRILNERGENIKEKFDFVISRAVTNFSEFVSWVTGKFSDEQKHTLRNGILYLKGGDLSEELKDFLPGITQYHISKFFEEPFFETKKVIYLPVKA